MPKSKKPRKPYQPSDVVKPLNMRNPWLTEGDVHGALLALEGGQACEDHLAMLAAHGDIIRRIYPEDSAEHRQAHTIVRMVGLAVRREGFMVLPLEEAAIRAAVQVTLPALQRATNRKILDAANGARAFAAKHGGVRV